MEKSQKFLRQTLLPLIFVAVLTLLCFGEIRHYYFTDVDTFSLINDGRIQHFSDLLSIFTSELMSGRMVNASYYRPFTSLVFGIEYAFFGLKPAPYHTFNLLLFAGTAFLLIRLGQVLWGARRGTWIGGLAALFFILHPLQLDNLPAIARMGDLLFTFCLILSLYLLVYFLLGERASLRRPIAYFFSLLFCMLGLLSKEPAVIAPAIMFLAIFLFNQESSLPKRLRQTILVGLPYGLITAAYMSWRYYILHGLGGYVSLKGKYTALFFSSLRAKQTILGHPYGFFFSGLGDSFDHYVQFIFDTNRFIYPLAILFLIILVREITPSGRRLLQEPYEKNAPSALTDSRAFWLFGGILFLHFWLIFFTQFSTRYLYFSLTAFALVLALIVYKVGEGLVQKQPRYVATAFLALVLLVTYWGSPLWHKERLRRWQMGAQMAQTVVSDLEKIAAKPLDRVFLLNIPYSITYGSVSPILWEMPFNQMLLDHAIIDYLELATGKPTSALPDIVVLNYLFLTGPPAELQISSTFVDPQTLRVEVAKGGLPGEYPWTEIPGRKRYKEFFDYEGGRLRMERAPPEGWSKTMLIHLKPEALHRENSSFYTYDGSHLRDLYPPLPQTAALAISFTDQRSGF